MSSDPTHPEIIVDRKAFFDDGIVGRIRFPLLDSHPDFFSLELPWRNNIRAKSCVVAGSYMTRLREPSVRFAYPHVWVEKVEYRSGILFHRGNYPKDTRGCILVGLDASDEKPVVFDSKKGFTKFMECYGLTMAACGRPKLRLLIEE